MVLVRDVIFNCSIFLTLNQSSFFYTRCIQLQQTAITNCIRKKTNISYLINLSCRIELLAQQPTQRKHHICRDFSPVLSFRDILIYTSFMRHSREPAYFRIEVNERCGVFNLFNTFLPHSFSVFLFVR